MTNLLVNTQILIWIQTDNGRISSKARDYSVNPSVVKWISEVSLFEIAIKQKIGKLPEFGVTLTDFINQAREDKFCLLPVDKQHIVAYERVPLFEDHRDPFDRLLLTTALHEGWPVMSSDYKFSWYADQIEVIW